MSRIATKHHQHDRHSSPLDRRAAVISDVSEIDADDRLRDPDHPDRPGLVILTIEAFDQLLDRIDDAVAAAALRAGGAAEEAIPDEVARRLISGENPVRVWREHRGMTQDHLAVAAGIGKADLSEIETGRKPGTLEELRAVAKTLAVDLDDLAP